MTRVRAAFAVVLFATSTLFASAATPDVGGKAPDFTLTTPEGAKVELNSLTEKSPVVLVELRGYPGYQCPYCQKQVHDYLEHASAFAQDGAQVLLVYPGPPADLGQHAKDFLAGQTLPDNFHLVLDPDYSFTRLYDLRWNEPHETAYPSTFIVNRQDTVVYRKISRTHGDRTTAADVLAELGKAGVSGAAK